MTNTAAAPAYGPSTGLVAKSSSAERSAARNADRALALATQNFADEFSAERIATGLAAMAPNSVAALVSDVRHYRTWAAKVGLAPFPLEERTVGRYLHGLERSGRRPSTAARRLASLARFVRLVGHHEQLLVLQSDFVRDTLRAYERRKGVKVRKAAPIRLGNPQDPIGGEGVNLLGLVAACGDDLRGVRDAAVLMALYAGGLRVSELTALRVGDFAAGDAGSAALFLRSSKTDQLGEGATVPLAPIAAERIVRWIELAGLAGHTAAPLFRRIVTYLRRQRVLARPSHIGRSLVDYVAEVRRTDLARAQEPAAEVELAVGPKAMTRQGVLHLVRRVVAAAIDGSFIDIGSRDRSEVIAAVGTHSFRIGLTHDLFARNFDVGRVMLAQRWSSATTAIGYARDLAAADSAVIEFFSAELAASPSAEAEALQKIC